MRRAPGLVLVAALASTAMGALLLAFSGQEPVLAWYGAPVTGLGLVLVGLWARDYRKPTPTPDTPETLAANLPGPWYPVAILGIAAVLMAWVIYWTKAR